MPTELETMIKAITDRVKPWQRENALFYKGDHWQAGDGWAGQRPIGVAQAAWAMGQIERIFVASNVIKEITDRFASTLIGREPQWTMVARDDSQAAALDTVITETNEVLTSWWDTASKKIMRKLFNATAGATLNRYAYLRVFIPPAIVNEQGRVVAALTFAEAMRFIWLDDGTPEHMAHLTNAETMELESRRAYEITREGKKIPRVERQRIIRLAPDPANPKGPPVESITGEPLTLIEVLEQVNAEGPPMAISAVALPLGGHLLTFELELNSQIGEPMRRLQKALNVVLTMMQHNILGSGFLERVFLNAQMPGEWVKAPEGHPEAIGGWLLKPAPYEAGLGVVNSIQGTPITDKDTGQTTGYATPSIWTHDPVDTTTFSTAESTYYQRMLKEAGQLHAVLSGDAVASGESRQQALADFISRIEPAATALQSAVRWILEVATYLAAHLAGEANSARLNLRANVKLRLALPPLSADMMRVINELVEKGLISQETGLTQLPFIDDPAAEIQQQQAEQADKRAAAGSALATSMLNALESTNGGTALTQPTISTAMPITAPAPTEALAAPAEV